MENLNINIATINGSGSQSANNILVKTLFRMNYGVSGKNLFPSNIQGLPTWFQIRINSKGYSSLQKNYQIAVNVNPKSLKEDINKLDSSGLLICGDDSPSEEIDGRSDIQSVAIPYKKLIRQLEAPIKIRKLLTNMVYVGALQWILDLDEKTLEEVVIKTFKSKSHVYELNLKAISLGYEFMKESFPDLKIPLTKGSLDNSEKVLIDGNSASAMGVYSGGCQFLAWYPITPSSSLGEKFIELNNKFSASKEKSKRAVVQAEDELSAISMVLGAGWTGARALTATSGPGLSLMAEAAGLSYFAEIPAVLWDVQRCGPSTGLPTRTQQGDVSSALYLSHGDTQHIVLFPSSPKECFEFGQACFDLADQLQTLVIVLSDLDLGMNNWSSPRLSEVSEAYKKGKIKSAEDLDDKYGRYADLDKDGIGHRTLPGTPSEFASYFTRGTAHDEKAKYSETPDNYKELTERLVKKFETAKLHTPKPEITQSSGSQKQKLSVVYFGSTEGLIPELEDLLAEKNIGLNKMRVKSFPFHEEVENFLNSSDNVFVVEQNNQGQFFRALQSELDIQKRIHSIAESDGYPMGAHRVLEMIQKSEVISGLQ